MIYSQKGKLSNRRRVETQNHRFCIRSYVVFSRTMAYRVLSYSTARKALFCFSERADMHQRDEIEDLCTSFSRSDCSFLLMPLRMKRTLGAVCYFFEMIGINWDHVSSSSEVIWCNVTDTSPLKSDFTWQTMNLADLISAKRSYVDRRLLPKNHGDGLIQNIVSGYGYEAKKNCTLFVRVDLTEPWPKRGCDSFIHYLKKIFLVTSFI